MATSVGLRRHDLDNLRTFLTGLVTVHHTALAYGGLGGWPFKSRAVVLGSPVLLGFNMFNQSFFMGLFFWISGRVSAQSLERSTDPVAFLKNKALRLGVPALVYTLVVAPAVRLIASPLYRSMPLRNFLWDYYTSIRSVRGSLWYTATLLSFDVVATILKELNGPSNKKVQHDQRAFLYEKLKKYGWLAVAIGNFWAKTRYPLGSYLPILSLQPAYAFQYIYAYVLGYLAHSSGDRTMKGPFDPSPVAKSEGNDEKVGAAETYNGFSLPTAVVISLLSIGLLYVPRYLDTSDWVQKSIEQAFGGWNLPCLLYSLWSEVSFHLVGPTLMSYFEQWHNKPAASPTWNPRYSYASFLVHEPINVAMEVLIDKVLLSENLSGLLSSPIWHMSGSVFMTITVGLTGAWASSFVGRKILELIPSSKKII